MAQAIQISNTNVVVLRTPASADHHTRLVEMTERAREALEYLTTSPRPEHELEFQQAYFLAARAVDEVAEQIWETPARTWSDVIARAELARFYTPCQDDHCPVYARAAAELTAAVLRVGRGSRA